EQAGLLAERGDRERGAGQLFARQRGVARGLGQAPDLDRQLEQAELVRVVHDRHDQTLIGRSRDPDVIVAEQYELVGLRVEAAVQDRVLLERRDHRLDREREIREVDAL